MRLIADRNRRAITAPGEMIFFPGGGRTPAPTYPIYSYHWTASVTAGSFAFTAPVYAASPIFGADTDTGNVFASSLVPLLGACTGSRELLSDTTVGSVATLQERVTHFFSTTGLIISQETPAARTSLLNQKIKLATPAQHGGMRVLRQDNTILPGLCVQGAYKCSNISTVLPAEGDYMVLAYINTGPVGEVIGGPYDQRVEARITRTAGVLRYGVAILDGTGFELFSAVGGPAATTAEFDTVTLYYEPSLNLADTVGGRVTLTVRKEGESIHQPAVDQIGGTRVTSSGDPTPVSLFIGNAGDYIRSITALAAITNTTPAFSLQLGALSYSEALIP